MKIRNILLMGLSFVLVALLAIGGTVAYLSDSDTSINVMTLGNVKIVQHEYERATNEDGSYKTATFDGMNSYVLKEFTQEKPLLPIVGDPNEPGDSPAYAGYDSIRVRMTQVGSYGSMDVFAGKNAQDKFVTVENTGKTDAYIRTIVAIEIGSTDGSLIGTSYHQTWTKNEVGTITIDGNNYYVFEYIYAGAAGVRHENGVLPAGDTSYPNLSQVYLNSAATNEDCAALDGNGNGTLDILVMSQAVQTNGFADAKTALDTAFGTPAEKAAKWFGGKGDVQYAEANKDNNQVLGEEAAEVLDALNSGKDLILDKEMDILGFDTNEVDAKGATATLSGTGAGAYGYLAFLPDAGEDVTVSNLNVTGSGFVEVGHWGMGGGDYTVNSLNVKDLASTLATGDKGFTLACAFCHYGNAVLNDCEMTGATALTEGALAVDAGFVNDTTTVVNGGKYGTVYCWSHAVVTINGAEVDTMYVAPIKGTVTIKAGTVIGTLNVAYGTSAADAGRLSKLVIEEGAQIGKIVFSDKNNTAKTFTSVADWNAFVDGF